MLARELIQGSDLLELYLMDHAELLLETYRSGRIPRSPARFPEPHESVLYGAPLDIDKVVFDILNLS